MAISHYQNLPFEIPENWVWARFQDIFNIIMGQSPSGEYISSDGEYEFHQGRTYFGDKILLSSQTFTSYPTKLAQSHSLLLCVRAPVGDINITNREICIGRGLCSLKPLNEISLGFAYYWVSYFKNSFVNKATGTTFLAISSETIRNEFIPIPPLKEQMIITKTINSLYNMLDNITTEL
ncbi:restriction endonuclease subunit S [uncultured Chryseobacterium sp.]|uniref:restriction endonuclease subunit S n=1 Tax=uncultured Chryseobacterium sp. TaxID=259322 RepID=UPI0025D3F356|nr:restriction endonuclease subunit S [uncultured Chryseobacterium sp.]